MWFEAMKRWLIPAWLLASVQHYGSLKIRFWFRLFINSFKIISQKGVASDSTENECAIEFLKAVWRHSSMHRGFLLRGNFTSYTIITSFPYDQFFQLSDRCVWDLYDENKMFFSRNYEYYCCCCDYCVCQP